MAKSKNGEKETKKRDLFTIKFLFIVLNIIYVVFDFIQIKSLLLHSVASNINYAEYARQGFFQLMIVSVINIAIILISKKFENKDNEKEFKFIKAMGILMVLLTIVIIISSFLRMQINSFSLFSFFSQLSIINCPCSESPF